MPHKSAFTRQRRALSFMAAAAMMLLVMSPMGSRAQFGGLANMAKAKALEALNDKVMQELEKKFADAVANQPISKEAKAAVVKKLCEMARPTVKRFIDGAASGKLPNPAELVQTVMKDIQSRIPEVIAAATAESGGGAAAAAAAQQGGAYGQQAYGAAPAQPPENPPKIAVYASGAEDPAVNKALTTRIIAALSGSGRYTAVDEYKEFFEQAAKENKGGAASLNTEQIQRLGWNFGVEYVCAAEITTVLGERQISARVVSVETGAVAAIGVADSPLKTLSDVAAAAEQIVGALSKNAPPPAPAAAPAYAPPLSPPPAAAMEQPEVQPSEPAAAYDANQQALRDALAWAPSIDDDFTDGERLTAFGLNLLVPGLGSGVIMRDRTGAAVQVALATVGPLLALGASPTDGFNAVIPTSIVPMVVNFVYNITRSANYTKYKTQEVKKRDHYYAPKYQIPVGTPVSWGGNNVEAGWIWGEGAFFGIDFSVGTDKKNNKEARLIGGGLSIGKAYDLYDLGNQLQFAYGLSVGIWSVSERESDTNYYPNGYYDYYRTTETRTESINFLAPFVKFRWSVIEITYRGLLGHYEKSTSDSYGSNYDNNAAGLGWNNHQLMLGLYFATSKRARR